MHISCYPYDINYRIEREIIFIYLYCKLEDGTKVCLRHNYQPYFYAKIGSSLTPQLLSRIEQLKLPGPRSIEVTKTKKIIKRLLGKEEQFLQVFVSFPQAVPHLAKEIQSWGVPCYEKDIPFVHRYLRDFGITPLTMVEVKGRYIEDKRFRVPVFDVESVEQDSNKQKTTTWRTLAIDIETYAKKKEINPQKNPILMIGLYGTDVAGKTYQKVITWKKFISEPYVEIVDSERIMLERMQECILELQPDILAGYFSDGFDFPYLQQRAEKLKVKFDLGLDYSGISLKGNTNVRAKEAQITGYLHLDVFKFVSRIFGKNLKTDSYSLNSVAEELLGSKKQEVSLDKLYQVWDSSPEELGPYCAYNLYDADLTWQLCTKLFPDMFVFTSLLGLPPAAVIRMNFSKLVENYIIKSGISENVIAPNKPEGNEIEERMNESIKGAFVYEPTPGLYKDIVIFDFRSLYPTIIVAHNIGPESFHCSCCFDKATVPGKEEYWFCLNNLAFLPRVLDNIVERRRFLKEQLSAAAKEERAILNARSYALKILANSFYGYLGFFAARWYCRPCAAATTAYARDYIGKTIELAQDTGFKVLYADTDSCFLLLREKTQQDAMQFMAKVNKKLPHQMELEFEGHFPRGLFVAQKGSERGAKKKYALLSSDGKIKITGFESVRRNWSQLAKEVQQKVLKLILNDQIELAFIYVKKSIQDLLAGEVPLEKLILRTQLTRELSKYTSVGPHVMVAMKLAEKGEPVLPGTVVEYIITEGSGLVRERASLPDEVMPGKYDKNYYLYHQLLPAVSAIFLVLGYDEDELLGKAKQVGLNNFF